MYSMPPGLDARQKPDCWWTILTSGNASKVSCAFQNLQKNYGSEKRLKEDAESAGDQAMREHNEHYTPNHVLWKLPMINDKMAKALNV